MDFCEYLWDKFNTYETPDITEIQDLIKSELHIGLTRDDITEEYIILQKLYKYLFSMYFIEKSRLDSLDQRIYNKNYHMVSPDEMDFYQKYDMLDLNYFYLRSFVHIERLYREDLDKLDDCLKNPDNENTWKNAMNIVEKTYHTVIAVHPDKKEQWFELFPSVFGEGRVQGKNIVFTLKYDSAFNGDTKNNYLTLYKIKEQLEPVLTKQLQTDVIVLVEG